MKTTTLIQKSAHILRLTELKKGDTIKLIKESSYDSSSKKYGIVMDLLNTGEKTYIELLIFKYEYSSFTAEVILFKGTDDVSIFPATPENIKCNFDGIIRSLEAQVESTKKDLNTRVKALQTAQEYMSGKMAEKLKASSFEVITQIEYEEEKKQKIIEAKKREIENIA